MEQVGAIATILLSPLFLSLASWNNGKEVPRLLRYRK